MYGFRSKLEVTTSPPHKLDPYLMLSNLSLLDDMVGDEGTTPDPPPDASDISIPSSLESCDGRRGPIGLRGVPPDVPLTVAMGKLNIMIF